MNLIVGDPGGQVPMDATAFIASEQQPNAVQYYQTFPSEPVLGVLPSGFIRVEQPVVPISSIDSFKLFTKIAQHRPENVLIVSHGFGGGLAIPLISKAERGLGLDEVNVLNQYVGTPLADEEAASRLKLSTKDVLKLKNAILNVKQLGINQLVMRACIVGTFVETLEGLRQLFGARSACGPDLLGVFGQLNPGTPADKKTFASFIESASVIVEGKVPNRFAWKASINDVVKLETKAESRQAVTDWISRHFPNSKRRGSGPFAFEALIDVDRLIFPLDQEYRGHLKRAERGKKQ